MRQLYFFIVIILWSNPIQAQLYINEFMAANDTTIADNAGEYDDWIEVYNAENFDVNLSGYYLTDDLDEPMKWGFPNVIIPANGYLLVWADDNLGQSGLHANFKLSADGEQVGLYDGMVFIDYITYGVQYTDVSYGRMEDGHETWVLFEAPDNPPSPKSANVYQYIQVYDPPIFTPDEGFYTGNVAVELSTNEPDVKIYYTLDGSIPTTAADEYTGPINISEPTTIRAIVYKQVLDNYDQVSEVATKCYFVDVENDIPLIHVTCDPVEFDEIYNPRFYQPGKPHPSISAHFKYFDSNKVLQGDLPISFSLHGGFSVTSPKKSLKIVFTHQNFQYDLFDQEYLQPRSPNIPSSFKSFNLIGMAADYSLIRNYLAMQLLRNAGFNSPQLAFVRLFVNGNDRGIYVPIERIDERYVKNHGFEPGNYDIIKTGCQHECDLTLKNLNGQHFELKAGDFEAFDEFLEWLYRYGHKFDELIKRVDLSSFLYYDMMCRFSNNRDSYDINYYLIKNRDVTDSKWIIFLWDTDESFGWDRDYEGRWVRFNFLFDRLWHNENYVYLFYNTLADLLNTKWSYQEIDKLIQKIESLFQTDNPVDEAIWNSAWYSYGSVTIPNFREDPQYNPLSRYRHLNFLREWVQNRIDFALKRFRWSGGKAQLTIDPPTGGNGSIQLNSLHLTNFPWTGTYFREIPIPLTAIPNNGYCFVGWSDPSVPQTEQIEIILDVDYRIHAIFEPDPSFKVVVINEINYNSADNFDPEDWIELYNPSDEAVDVSGWHLKDDDNAHDFIFPQGTTMSANGYLVLCRDQSLFHARFPDVMSYIGDIGFGLSGSGDQVRIFNASLLLIDSVQYDDVAPWPPEPDGNGPTLELINPDLDNSVAESWQASQNHGTPGKPSSTLFGINGNVCYYSSSNPVPQALISVTIDANRSTTTDTSGDYQISALQGGDYSLKSSKENDVNRTIGSFDAAWILQHNIGLRTFTSYQMIAGDVSGNGDVSAYDAAFVLQYGVDLINKFPIMDDTTHFWRFVPEDFPISLSNWKIAPDSIVYTPLNSDTTANYVGILYGDVTGNWYPSAGGLARSTVATVDIKLEDIYGKPGDKISVPVYVDHASDIVAMNFTLAYDPLVLKARDAFLTSLTKDYLIAYNVKEGQINVALAGSQPIKGSGAVVKLAFEVLDTDSPEANSPLQITEMVINEGSIAADIQAAKFEMKSTVPTEYALHQNYPNPFNPETVIKYQLPKSGKVILKIYNPLGQEIRTLVNEDMEAGYHEARWDGMDDKGVRMSSGIYIYRFQAGKFINSRKMLLLR